MNRLLPTTVVVALLFTANCVYASGGLDFNSEAYQTRIDRLYEKGKNYFHASNVDGERLKYCVRDGDQATRVSRKSLKQFQKTSLELLSDSLVNCDQPENLIASHLAPDQMTAVLYYLDKRYRLSLYENS